LFSPEFDLQELHFLSLYSRGQQTMGLILVLQLDEHHVMTHIYNLKKVFIKDRANFVQKG
jgi:hypothetical protein